LLAAGRKLGAMILTSEKPHEFSDREKRVFASLAPQIAIAIQNKSLLEAAQNRARREKILREITAQVRSSNDVDTILQIAAEQVGRAFGRPAFVALESAQKQNE
ncbi:MAG: GAF domain-containing protein, partial [Anaerolineales bacterium]|nr:GAF domain-containing protein [Anaerolineales bacterium]